MAELQFTDRMSDSDALMWSIEKDPLLRSTIVAVTMLDLARDPTVDLGPLPEIPEPQHFSATELLTDGVAHEIRRQGGIISRLAGEVIKAARTPSDTATAAGDMAGSLVRMMAPAF